MRPLAQRLQYLCSKKIDQDLQFQTSSEIEEQIKVLLSPKGISSLESMDSPSDSYLDEPQISSLIASACGESDSLFSTVNHSTYILVGGVGRSGTTAFSKVLSQFLFKPRTGVACSAHIFTERYSWKLPYSPHSFLPTYVLQPDNRFSGYLSAKPGSRQIDHLKTYRSHYYVGDKRPGAAFLLNITDHLFSLYSKPLVYVHLVRNPEDTGLSWLNRSQDPNDSWPASWDHTMMARHFISQGNIIKKLASQSNLLATKLVLLEYERFYFDAKYCSNALLFLATQLGLSSNLLSEDEIDQFVNRNIGYSASRGAHVQACKSRDIVGKYLETSNCDKIYHILRESCKNQF